MFDWFRKQKADIVFLQETFSSKDNEIMWRSEWGGEVIYNHGSNHSRGVAVLLSNKTNFKITNMESDNSGRIILMQGTIDEEEVNLVNIYAPTAENAKVAFFIRLRQFLRSCKLDVDSKIIIGGDFNTVLGTNDKKGGRQYIKHNSVVELENILEDLELCDIWRVKHPERKRFTWRQKNPLIQCRLDLFLISENLMDSVGDVKILPSFKSDHSAVCLDFTYIEDDQRGRGYWKFNSSLIADPEYTNEMKKNIKIWKEELRDINDERVVWEILKYNIRRYSQKYSSQKANKAKDREGVLTEELSKLEQELNENNLNNYESLKKELEKIVDKKTDGVILRLFSDSDKSRVPYMVIPVTSQTS